ncbi:MAG: ABC transporter ATP-binding protein [Candidatus Omnitrophica bacterium]|nr:ABC transporter ATP-binding protein [Candidatus Omnitrophota bacterium]
MAKFEIKNTHLYMKSATLMRFFRIMRVTPAYFIVTVFSSFIVAFFDGLSIGLLVPLAKGIVDGNFSFLLKIPIFKTIIAYSPQLFDKAPAKFLFILLVGTIFIAALTKNVFKYLANLYNTYQQGTYSLNLKKFIFDRYLGFGKLFFDRTSQGYITTTLGFSGSVVGLLNIFIHALDTFFTFVIYITILLIISWKLTIFSLIIFPILHYSLKWIIKKIEMTAGLQTKAALKLGREVFNVLSCIPLVKAYNKEEEAKRKYRDINELMRKLDFSMAKKTALVGPIQEIIMLIALVLAISAAAFMLIRGKLDEIAGFLVFFYLLRKIIPIFMSFNGIKISLSQTKPVIKEVLDIFNDKDKFCVPEGSRVFRGLERKIEFNHLSFLYKKNIPVLKDLGFTIEKGKMTAIVGPTGAGKTTIISLIMRFYDCVPSTILMDDVDIREFTSKSLRHYMALVSQEALLFNNTLRYNIGFGIEEKINEERLIDIAKKARLYDFIMKLPEGFDTEVGDRGIRLSGGEKQRVSIARALLKEAAILILDEATSSLDTHTERLIHEAIEEAVKDRTTIVIAHRLSTIKKADKIIVVEKGRFIEGGTLDELLLQKGKFYEYWEEQKFY